ncbi:MAG: hypothetical protein ACOYVG_08515 [Bacteroidota bacterium]
MNRKISIQLKALFLLLVFSLNTLVGFACALGMDMGFNSSHHNSDVTEVKEIHVHDDNVPVKQDQERKSLAGKDESGCCSDDVLKFQSVDKNLAQATNNIVNTQVFVAVFSAFFGVDFITIVNDIPPKFKVRFYYPPPADILLAIQRFQI